MSIDFIQLANRGVKSLHPYEPGKSLEEIERQFGINNAIKLASNENPLGPGPKALAAIKKTLEGVNFYPDNDSLQLKALLGEELDVAFENLVIGSGSTHLIDLIAHAYLGEGKEAIYSEFGFIYYANAIAANNATAVITKAIDWGYDLDAMVDAIGERTRLIFIANPNNPTGTWLTHAQVHGFLRRVPQDIIVVLDEAYIEYQAEDILPDSIALHREFPNVIVTRTFSKAFGLAGLRIGYAIASPDIANVLNRLRAPFSINLLSEVAAAAALNDQEHLDLTRQVNRNGLRQLASGLDQMGVGYIPSAGNFLSIELPGSAERVNLELLKKGVIVRSLNPYGMVDHLRVTVGTASQNRCFLEALSVLV